MQATLHTCICFWRSNAADSNYCCCMAPKHVCVCACVSVPQTVSLCLSAGIINSKPISLSPQVEPLSSVSVSGRVSACCAVVHAWSGPDQADFIPLLVVRVCGCPSSVCLSVCLCIMRPRPVFPPFFPHKKRYTPCMRRHLTPSRSKVPQSEGLLSVLTFTQTTYAHVCYIALSPVLLAWALSVCVSLDCLTASVSLDVCHHCSMLLGIGESGVGGLGWGVYGRVLCGHVHTHRL